MKTVYQSILSYKIVSLVVFIIQLRQDIYESRIFNFENFPILYSLHWVTDVTYV